MKLVLITGSCGLVGQEVTKLFIKKKYKVIGVDNDKRKFFFGKKSSVRWVKKILTKNNNYHHFNIDIKNKSLLEKKIFKKFKNIKAIIHCAAQPSHDWATNNPMLDFEINAKATLNLLLLTKDYNKKIPFIYLSTNKVYGDLINKFSFKEKKYRYEISSKHKELVNGVDENFSIDRSLHSLFGSSKLSADIYVQEFGNLFKMNTVCFRAGCLTGPMHSGAKLHGFLSYLVKCYVNNQTYTINGYKGKQVRDNIHSIDLANIIWEYFKKPKQSQIYNIGGGKFSNCSILEAIKICEKIGKKKFKYKIISKPRSGDHIWWVSNMKKFKKDYPNWKPKYKIKDIIEDIYLKLTNKVE